MGDRPTIDLEDFRHAVRRRWWLFPLLVLTAGAAAALVSSMQPDRFEATAQLLFRPVDPVPRIDPDAAPPASPSGADRVDATDLRLTEAAAGTVASTVARRLGGTLTPRELRDRVRFGLEGQAELLSVTATAPTPVESAQIANAFGAEIIALRRRRAEERVDRVIAAIRQQLSAGTRSSTSAAALRRRIDQLSVARGLQTGDAELAVRASASDARSSPSALRSGILGAAAGALLATLVAVAIGKVDRRRRDERRFAAAVGAGVIARVPAPGRDARSRREFLDALHFLRANVQLRHDLWTGVVAVASPLPGAGTTTIAAGWGEALAQSGSATILVDCNFRRPRLHEHFKADPGRGVLQALSERSHSDELLQETSTPQLGIVAAGALEPGEAPTSVLGLAALRQLFRELRNDADVVIVDAGAVTPGPESTVVAVAADAVILVVDENTDRDVLVSATEQLGGARARILGVVLNGVEPLGSKERRAASDGRGDSGAARRPTRPPTNEAGVDANGGTRRRRTKG